MEEVIFFLFSICLGCKQWGPGELALHAYSTQSNKVCSSDLYCLVRLLTLPTLSKNDLSFMPLVMVTVRKLVPSTFSDMR